ncbi:N-acetylmuramoyl-L-alanine amidase, partial [Muriicola sp.]|uniref:N-acetylmuramoyl-L-alanine amidase family protein n=1 Tax=Muriicola sp. TaxID=2020856 RepID=UPI003567C33C
MNKKLLFAACFCFLLTFELSASDPVPTSRGDEGFVVVLDAGHGGHDPGNLGNGYMEKNIALSIVLKIGEELKKIPGIKVV